MPSNTSTLNLDFIDQQLSPSSNFTTITEMHSKINIELQNAYQAMDLPRIAQALHLSARSAWILKKFDEAAELQLKALKAFGLLNDPQKYQTCFEELVQMIKPQAKPYPHSLSFFEDLRHRLRILLREWTDFTRPQTSTSSQNRSTHLYVNDTEISDYFKNVKSSQEGKGPPSSETPEMLIAGLIARLSNSPADEKQNFRPIQHMMEHLSLNPIEVWILLLLYVGQTDPVFRRVITFAWNDFSQKVPDLSFVSGILLGPPSPIWNWMRTLLSSGAPLMQYGLVNRRNTEGGLELVSLTPSAVRLLNGGKGLPAELGEWCQSLDVQQKDLGQFEGESYLNRILDSWTQHKEMLRQQRLRILLLGSHRDERRRAVIIAAKRAGFRVIQADLGVFRFQPFDRTIHALSVLAREASLSNRIVLINLPAAPRDEQQQLRQGASLSAALEQGLQLFVGPVLISIDSGSEIFLPTLPGALEVEITRLTAKKQVLAWKQALQHYNLKIPSDDNLQRVIQRFPLGEEAISEACREIWVKATLLGEVPNPDALIVAAGRKTRHAMGSVAQRISTTLSWDDVVLPPETISQLKEIVSFARHRNLVLNEWGFRSKLPYGRALSALFWGAPGTGKTMMAGIIARELGMEIFRIDLSQIVSKYIGETEKNLARAFDEATRNHAVLLFDEADSLFSKRTEVKSSNDRNANLEVNFLLQRMESFEGVTILTTNLQKSIDDAFKRRVRFKIEFPFPDEDERGQLWEIMIPQKANVERNIMYEHLGTDFEMSGGSIKNAVIRAAFMAAEKGKVIGFDELWEAGQKEYAELGHLIRKNLNDDL